MRSLVKVNELLRVCLMAHLVPKEWGSAAMTKFLPAWLPYIFRWMRTLGFR